MAFACWQWFGARKIVKKMAEREFGSSYLHSCQVYLKNTVDNRKWTTVEGHFLQMGGIIVRVGPKGPCKFWGVQEMLENEAILDRLKSLRRTVITKEGIQDRSKASGLRKAIVLVQTAWFTIACIAREVQGLAFTELEIVTLAYTVLNGMILLFWWNKPLDVECPVIIEIPPQEPVASKSEGGSTTPKKGLWGFANSTSTFPCFFPEPSNDHID
jgi:hypothetical protein